MNAPRAMAVLCLMSTGCGFDPGLVDDELRAEYMLSRPCERITELRFMTFNLWRPGPRQHDRVDAILREARKADVDFLLLQEVMVDDGGNVADIIARELGGAVLFRAGKEELTFHEGLAVVSRYPLSPLSASGDLPQGDGGSRTWVRGVVDFIQENPPASTSLGHPLFRLQVTNVHLNSGKDEEGRMAQMTHVAGVPDTFDDADHAVHILGGDLNAHEDERLIHCLRGATGCPFTSDLVDTYRYANPCQDGYTWDCKNPNTHEWDATLPQGDSSLRSVGGHPWNEPDRRLDYVFFGVERMAEGTPALFIRESRLMFDEPNDGEYLSDHFAVLTTIEVPGLVHANCLDEGV